ncbi:MAG: RecQ family zinc-binding domain-containing protein, partial [Anaerolineales bacterium]
TENAPDRCDPSEFQNHGIEDREVRAQRLDLESVLPVRDVDQPAKLPGLEVQRRVDTVDSDVPRLHSRSHTADHDAAARNVDGARATLACHDPRSQPGHQTEIAAQRIDSLLNQYAAIQQQRVLEIWDYARTARCRHGHLANYLGGQPRAECAACDNCSDEFDAYEAAQSAANARFPSEAAQYGIILQTLAEGSWGHATLNALLRGDTSINPRAQGSSRFGRLGFRSKTRLRKMIDRLVHAGFVREVTLSHGGIALEITPEGRGVMRDEGRLEGVVG